MSKMNRPYMEVVRFEGDVIATSGDPVNALPYGKYFTFRDEAVEGSLKNLAGTDPVVYFNSSESGLEYTNSVPYYEMWNDSLDGDIRNYAWYRNNQWTTDGKGVSGYVTSDPMSDFDIINAGWPRT